MLTSQRLRRAAFVGLNWPQWPWAGVGIVLKPNLFEGPKVLSFRREIGVAVMDGFTRTPVGQ